MGLSDRSFELLKKSSHRFPKRLYRLVNEGFEVTRGVVYSLYSSSKTIAKTQRRLLQENYSKETKGLIIFLTPGVDIINGGILSVTSLFNETKRLKQVHRCEVILCTYPSDPALLKYTKFANDNLLYSFSDVLSFFSELDKIVIHIPEHFIYRFNWFLTKTDKALLRKIRNVQINVMIQNIDQLPSPKTIKKLASYGRLTSTTAHSKYSTTELRNRLGYPLHKLSVYLSPEQYYPRAYSEKENLMIISPDPHPMRKEILRVIQQNLPLLKTQVIKNMTYEDYKQTILRAKWALTFGEGLDGYFLETVFSGGVSFSVYNSRFFTSDFRGLRTVYENYPSLASKIVNDLTSLDCEEEYSGYQKREFELCKSLYDYEVYLKNLEAFYRGQYTYP
jgi:hypothetical protein